MNSNDRLLESFQTALMRRQQRVKDQNDRGDQDEANDLNSMNHIMGLTTQMGEGQAQRDMLVQQHADTMARELARDRAREAHEKTVVNMQGQKQMDLANHWTQQSKDAQQLQDDKQAHEVEQAKAKQLMAEKMAQEKYDAELAKQRSINAAALLRKGIPSHVVMEYTKNGDTSTMPPKATIAVRGQLAAQVDHHMSQLLKSGLSVAALQSIRPESLNPIDRENWLGYQAAKAQLDGIDDDLFARGIIPGTPQQQKKKKETQQTTTQQPPAAPDPLDNQKYKGP